MTFDFGAVTLTFHIFSSLYLLNCNVQDVDTWQEYWLECIGVIS